VLALHYFNTFVKTDFKDEKHYFLLLRTYV